MLSNEPHVCPPELLAKGRREHPVTMAIIGAGEAIALESARRAADAGLIEPCLVGDPDAIADAAREIGWDISRLRIVRADDEKEATQTSAALARGGEVGALMKGHVHTDVLMRGVVTRSAGLRTHRRISHIFYMTAPGRAGALTITDAAVNIHPGVAEKLDIVQNAVDALHALGCAEPKVAVLSGTEVVSDTMPSSVAADEVSRRAAGGEVTGALVAGPMALDAAISPAAAATKGIENPVAGQADILLVPNIETGNTLFKAMVYFMSATAAGLVLGATVPIVLTSRADPPEARLAAAALAAAIAAEDSD